MTTVVRLYLFLLISVFASACGCPDTHGAPDVKAQYELERDAACAAVPGCDADYLAEIPVKQWTFEQVSDVCDDPAVGCFCDRPGCSLIVYAFDPEIARTGKRPQDIVLHEYVHAAFYSVGVSTHDHGKDWLSAFYSAFDARDQQLRALQRR